MKEVINVSLIESYIHSNNLSKEGFANQINVSVDLLNKILNGYCDFDVAILFRIAKIINCPVHKMFVVCE